MIDRGEKNDTKLIAIDGVRLRKISRKKFGERRREE